MQRQRLFPFTQQRPKTVFRSSQPRLPDVPFHFTCACLPTSGLPLLPPSLPLLAVSAAGNLVFPCALTDFHFRLVCPFGPALGLPPILQCCTAGFGESGDLLSSRAGIGHHVRPPSSPPPALSSPTIRPPLPALAFIPPDAHYCARRKTPGIAYSPVTTASH